MIKVCDGVSAPCVSAMLFSFPSLGASAVVGDAYQLAGISGYGLQRSFSGCCSSLRLEFLCDALPAAILLRLLLIAAMGVCGALHHRDILVLSLWFRVIVLLLFLVALLLLFLLLFVVVACCCIVAVVVVLEAWCRTELGLTQIDTSIHRRTDRYADPHSDPNPASDPNP